MQTRACSRKRKFEENNTENGGNRQQVPSIGFDWNQLPIELWLEVSKYFYFMEMFQLRRVNKTFNRAINTCISFSNRLTSSSLCRNGHLQIITNKMIEKTFSPSNQWQALNVLELEGWHATMVSTSLITISKNAKNLEEISISCDGIKRMHFRSFVKTYPRLRRFKLMSTGSSLSLANLKTFFNNCQLLTQLSLSLSDIRFEFNGVDVSDPVEASKHLFPNRSPYLEDLHLFFPNLDLSERLDPLICATFSQSLVKLANYSLPNFPMPNLAKITTSKVDWMEVGPWLKELDEVTVFSYWNQYPKLCQLSLGRGVRSFHHQGNNIAVSTAIFSLPNCPVRSLSFDFYVLDDLSLLSGIERLYFGQCKGLFCENLKNMLLNNPSLTDLSLCTLEDFCDDLLPFIGANCKQLEFLSIGDNRGFNFTHLLAFAEAHRAAVGASSIVRISTDCKSNFLKTSFSFIVFFHLDTLSASVQTADDELLRSHGVHLLRPSNRKHQPDKPVYIPNIKFTKDNRARLL